MDLRRDLRPGDMGAIVALHGRVYATEFGLDATFESDVAASIAEAARAGWPHRPGDGVWLVDDDAGRAIGALALSDEGDGLGRLRWFVLEAGARGAGLGRRMVGELMVQARAHGYARLWLETFDELAAAAHLYRDAGFVLASSQRKAHWGRELTVEHHEARL